MVMDMVSKCKDVRYRLTGSEYYINYHWIRILVVSTCMYIQYRVQYESCLMLLNIIEQNGGGDD